MMEFYYVGGYTGEKINLIDGDFTAQNVELFLKSTWNYTSLGAIDNRAVIKGFRKGAEERKLQVQVLADTEDEFNRVMTEAHRVFEADVRNATPGRLWCNGYYMDAYAIEDTHDSFQEYLLFVQKTIKFLLPSPFWTKENKRSFYPLVEDDGKIDFPVDMPFDLGRDTGYEFFKNDAVGAARFRMTVYGPCVNPVITLGGHAYGFDGLTVPSGAYVVIDSVNKTAELVAANGARTNVFDLRDRDSYIFEPIPPGNVEVSRVQTLAFDLVIYDERGLPPWI